MRSIRTLLLSLFALYCALPATAVPTTAVSSDTAPCDVLSVPSAVDELGNPPAPPFGPAGPFPADEAIASIASPTNLLACPATSQNTISMLVQITNLTTIAFDNLWYVRDPETPFSNVDGIVNGMEAFQIDAVGVNAPLVSESIAFDGIFAPGETWNFIVQDFANVCGALPHAFGSIGVPSSPGGCAPDGSSASIIATAVPEPVTAALVGLGALALSAARRRQARSASPNW
jgi:hypothetical protein